MRSLVGATLRIPYTFTVRASAAATGRSPLLGALVRSLSRPYGGKLADRFGGTRITIGAFTAMGLGILSVVLTLALQSFAIFLLCFLVLFAAAGIGNGSTYRMIPTIFALRAKDGVGAQREAAAALGLISAIGAYGGFFIAQLLGLSRTASHGDPHGATTHPPPPRAFHPTPELG